jgi:ligand-binding SRPBCC domain-containing protein
MNTIRLTTWIDAPVERCFLLSLSVDLHVASAQTSKEKAVDGITTGLISEGETVTFQGRHFGKRINHISRVEVMRPYSYFRDAMVSGVFRRFEHEHHFAAMDDGTRIRDEIQYSVPWGIFGRLATRFYVQRYLTEMITKRNAFIKQVAESDEWHRYLDGRRDIIVKFPEKNPSTRRWDSPPILRGSQS